MEEGLNQKERMLLNRIDERVENLRRDGHSFGDQLREVKRAFEDLETELKKGYVTKSELSTMIRLLETKYAPINKIFWLLLTTTIITLMGAVLALIIRTA